MTTPTTYPSSKQFLALAKETTQGTPVTPGTYTQPMTKFQPKDDPVWLEDLSLTGDMAELNGLIQGPQKSTFSVDGAVFLDGLPHWLLNIYGAVATAGPVSSIYTHTVSLLNSGTGQPPSHTLIHWDGVTDTTHARTFAGACLAELTVKGNPESTLIEMSGKGSGYWSAAYPSSEPTAAPSAVLPLAAWRMEIALGGTLPAAKILVIRDWEFTIAREISVQHTAQNSQAPYIIQRGAVRVTGKFSWTKPDDTTALDFMRDNTQPQMQMLLSNGLGGASAQTLQVDVNQCAFRTAEIDTGDEAIGYQTEWEGVKNTTNAGASGGKAPAKFVITNAVASY